MADYKNAKLTHQLTLEGAWPSAVAFVADEKIVAGNLDGQMYLWDLNASPVELTGEQTKNGDLKDRAANVHPELRFDAHTNGITRLLTADGGKALISASLDHTIQLWDTTANSAGEAEAVLDIAQRLRRIKRDGSNEEEVLSLPGIKVAVQKPQQTLRGHADWILGCALSANEQRLLTGDDSGVAILWDFPARKEIRRWQGHKMNGVVSTAVGPDARRGFIAEHRMARGSFDIPPAQAKIFGLDEGEMLVDLLSVKFPEEKARDNSYNYGSKWRKWVGNGFVASAFSPDGKIFAVGMGGEIGDAQVHLIDVESGKEIRTVSKHTGGVCDVAFTADGAHLLTAGRDTVLKVIHVTDGKEVTTLGKPRGGQFKDWLSAVAISPSGKNIAAADIAGIVHVWSV